MAGSEFRGPSKTAALTTATRCAPRGDQRIRCFLLMRAFAISSTHPRHVMSIPVVCRGSGNGNWRWYPDCCKRKSATHCKVFEDQIGIRFSTPIRAVSLPVPHSLVCCWITGLRSAWMAEVRMLVGSSTCAAIPCAVSSRCSQKPSRPASKQHATPAAWPSLVDACWRNSASNVSKLCCRRPRCGAAATSRCQVAGRRRAMWKS